MIGKPSFDQSLLDTLSLTLSDFAASPDGDDLIFRHDVPVLTVRREDQPAPALLALVLSEVIGADVHRQPYEKVHWTVAFNYKGRPASLALQKFGLRLRVAGDPGLGKELLGRLNKAMKVAERRSVQPWVKERTAGGHVEVENQATRFRHMYEFFREQAEESFSQPAPNEGQGGDLDGLVAGLNATFAAHAEGLYYGLAMLDAYFSWIEHVLVLLLPFAGYDPAQDDLIGFIGSRWGDKYQRVLGIDMKESKVFHDDLTTVKERLRNTFAHGGFEKRGASLFVPLEGYYPIPAMLSRANESALFHLFPMTESTLQHATDLLDRFDQYLAMRFPSGMMYVESGLNVPFTAAGRAKILEHANDLTAYEEWLDGYGQYIDMMQNADF